MKGLTLFYADKYVHLTQDQQEKVELAQKIADQIKKDRLSKLCYKIKKEHEDSYKIIYTDVDDIRIQQIYDEYNQYIESAIDYYSQNLQLL